MIGEIAVVSSRADPASMNIAARLLELAHWKDHGDHWSWGNYRLILTEDELSRCERVAALLFSRGANPVLVIFASRHVAKEGVPWLGGHFTGAIGSDGKLALSQAAPSALKSFMSSLRGLAPHGYRLSAEATHHGPTDLDIPSFFAEIGSGESEWSKPEPAMAVARAILSLEVLASPVFLGFGGGHYVQRQTEILLKTGASFGHLFSNYQVGQLDQEAICLARDRSSAAYAYLDRKSLRSEDKNRLLEYLSSAGLEVLRGREIEKRFPITLSDGQSGHGSP